MADNEANLDFLLKATPEFKAAVEKINIMLVDLAGVEMELEFLEKVKKEKREAIIKAFEEEVPRAEVEEYFPDRMVPFEHGAIGWGKSRRTAGLPDVDALKERLDDFGVHWEWIEYRVKSMAKVDARVKHLGLGLDQQGELAAILNIKGGEEVVNLRMDKARIRAAFQPDGD